MKEDRDRPKMKLDIKQMQLLISVRRRLSYPTHIRTQTPGAGSGDQPTKWFRKLHSNHPFFYQESVRNV